MGGCCINNGVHLLKSVALRVGSFFLLCPFGAYVLFSPMYLYIYKYIYSSCTSAL